LPLAAGKEAGSVGRSGVAVSGGDGWEWMGHCGCSPAGGLSIANDCCYLLPWGGSGTLRNVQRSCEWAALPRTLR
jgi:hypothetical protein